MERISTIQTASVITQPVDAVERPKYLGLIDFYPQNTGYGYWSEFCDSVICNMCGKYGYVEQGTEKCPACGEIGYLMDMEDLPHVAD